MSVAITLSYITACKIQYNTWTKFQSCEETQMIKFLDTDLAPDHIHYIINYFMPQGIQFPKFNNNLSIILRIILHQRSNKPRQTDNHFGRGHKTV